MPLVNNTHNQKLNQGGTQDKENFTYNVLLAPTLPAYKPLFEVK